jgi:ligand-binding sensor domain-containing protein
MYRTVALVALALQICGLSAQYADWVNYTPGQRCNSIAMENNYAWIATTGGLVRYDRQIQQKQFFNHANSGLPNNRATCVGVDPEGVKWICTYFGPLTRYDGSTWQSFYPAFWYNSFNSIAVAGVNDIWLGTEVGGLVHFDGTSFTQYTGYTDNPTIASAHAVTLDNLGRVWFSNYDGVSICGELVCWDGEGWSYLNHPEYQTAYSAAVAFAFDADNHIWIGTNTQGVFFYDGVNWTQYTEDNSQLLGQRVYSISVAPNSSYVYIGTEEGLTLYTGTYWAYYNTNTGSLSSNYVWDICFDEISSGWFATSDGVRRHLGTLWSQIDTSNSGLTAKPYNDQVQTQDGVHWIAGFDGLFRFDGQTWSKLTIPGSDQEILDIDLDSSGTLWMATRYSGVIAYDGTAFTDYTFSNSSLPGNNIRSLAVDSQDRVWIAMQSLGLCRFDQGEWTVWDTSNSLLPTNYLTMVEIDPFDNVWVNACRNTTEPAALIRISGDTWTLFQYDPDNPTIPTIWINDMKYRDGMWWFATSAGLSRYDGSTWAIYYDDYDANDNNFRRLAFDADGALWLTTGTVGIRRFHNEEFASWTMSGSGIASNSVNYIYIDGQGQKWIGHQYDGISVFSGGEVPVEDPILPPARSMSVWPNPFADTITFSLPESRGKARISLYNLRGQKTGEWLMPVKEKLTLDLRAEIPRGLANGVWLWKVETPDGVRWARSLHVK